MKSRLKLLRLCTAAMSPIALGLFLIFRPYFAGRVDHWRDICRLHQVTVWRYCQRCDQTHFSVLSEYDGMSGNHR